LTANLEFLFVFKGPSEWPDIVRQKLPKFLKSGLNGQLRGIMQHKNASSLDSYFGIILQNR